MRWVDKYITNLLLGQSKMSQFLFQPSSTNINQVGAWASTMGARPPPTVWVRACPWGASSCIMNS